MAKALELSIQIVVYAFLALIIFGILLFTVFSTTKYTSQLKASFKQNELDKIRDNCETLCEYMKNSNDYKSALLSNYCNSWQTISVSYNGKVMKVPVKCWWWPINVYCEKGFQLITENGLEEFIVKPFFVPSKEDFTEYAKAQFGETPKKTYTLTASGSESIVISYNGETETLKLDDLETGFSINTKNSYEFIAKFKKLFGSCVFATEETLSKIKLKASS